jgi:hypothetical protein
MDNKELKKLVKPLIRECLTEIFAEMNLEKIVEGVVNRSPKTMQTKLMNNVPSPPKQVNNLSNSKPKINDSSLRQALNINESEWQNIYGDIIDNPRLLAEHSKTDRQIAEENKESVPEDVLDNVGLMRDYSKFI